MEKRERQLQNRYSNKEEINIQESTGKGEKNENGLQDEIHNGVVIVKRERKRKNTTCNRYLEADKAIDSNSKRKREGGGKRKSEREK